MRIFILIAGLLVPLATFIGFFVSGLSPTFPVRTNQDYLRVVALAPSMSETMVALDQGHRLVGVTTHCQSPELTKVARIGSFADPNFEAIMAKNPDLVLAVPHAMAKNVLDKLSANHIEVFAHQPDSLADIKYITSFLANKFGITHKGVALNSQIDETISQAKKQLLAKTLGNAKKPTIIAVAPTPFVVAGPSTFMSQIIEELGFSNIVSDEKVAWPVWPLEHLLSHPPQYLILADGKANFSKYQKIFGALGLDLPKQKIQLIVPQQPIFYSPSPNIVKDIEHLANLLSII